MRFSLRNLLIVITLLFLLLPASQPVLDYIRRQRDYAQLKENIRRLHRQIETERRVRSLGSIGGDVKLQEAELRRLEEFLEAKDPLVPSSSP